MVIAWQFICELIITTFRAWSTVQTIGWRQN